MALIICRQHITESKFEKPVLRQDEKRTKSNSIFDWFRCIFSHFSIYIYILENRNLFIRDIDFYHNHINNCTFL